MLPKNRPNISPSETVDTSQLRDLNTEKSSTGSSSVSSQMMSATSAMNSDDGRPDDERGREPVQLAPLVDHHLERADEDDEEKQADDIDALAFDRRLAVAHQPPHDAADRRAEQDVDVEDPAPVVVVRDIASEDRPEYRRDHGRHAPDRQSDVRLFLREDRHQQRRRQRNERPAREPLQNPEQHEQRQGCPTGRTGSS